MGGQRQEEKVLNVTDNWSALLLHIQKIQGLNLGLETDYSNWGFL